MNLVEKDDLVQLYIVQKKTMKEAAKELNVAVGTVFNYIKKYDIKPRTQKEAFLASKEKGWTYPESARKRISKAHKGKTVSEETRMKMSENARIGGIGHKKKRKDGYIAIYFPDHPKSSKDGHIMEHILVMECLIGRHLKDNEVVHHKNGIRDDNRKENLRLMTFEEHASLHLRERYENGFIPHTKTRKVENVTTGEIFDSVKKAAEKYNVAATGISKACRHNVKIKKCHWRYVEEV